MEEMLRISAETWQSYWGEGYGSILTAVSFLYLLLFPGERKNRKALAGYTVVFLFLYFFRILQKSSVLVSEKWCTGEYSGCCQRCF